VLLFSAYWIAPFLAIVPIDWHDCKGATTYGGLSALMNLKNLNTGWPALVSLVVGFGAMVPFINTGLLVGTVAKALDGTDLSFYVGFVVAAVVYLGRTSSKSQPGDGLGEIEKPHMGASDTA
jgi:NCS1 family nucleobase:cation symporter-1